MRVIKLLTCALVLMAAFSSCQKAKVLGDQNGKVVTVSVKVLNHNAKESIYFYESVSRELLDSVFTDADGNLTLKIGTTSPSFYGLNVYGVQNESFIVGDKDLTIEIEGKENGSFKVEGSKDNEYLQQYVALKKELNAESMKWQERAYANPTQEELQKLIDEQKEYAKGYTQKVKSLIHSMGTSIAAIEVSRDIDVDEDAVFLEDLAKKLADQYPDSKLCADFKESILSMTQIAIGRTAPDFELQTLKGQAVKLSDYKGKYLLVDFWASWCGPCRRENPFVIKMYQKFGGENFEILGVSTDQSEVQWAQAIREDGLPWTQVRDTKLDASTKYNVSAIPFTVLIDREGQIIGKNLRGILLEEKLKELFL